MNTQAKLQIGKNGLTEGIIETLKNIFQTHQMIRVSVLKSGGHEKEKVKEMADKIVESLGKNYTYKIVGFTMIIQKWRKERKSK